MAITRMAHLALRCSDLERSRDFYTNLIGFEFFDWRSQRDVLIVIIDSHDRLVTNGIGVIAILTLGLFIIDRSNKLVIATTRCRIPKAPSTNNCAVETVKATLQRRAPLSNYRTVGQDGN